MKRDNLSKNRIAAIRLLDCLYYEPGNHRRCHKACYRQLVRPLFGISYATFRNYLHAQDVAHETRRLAPYIESGLRVMVSELLDKTQK